MGIVRDAFLLSLPHGPIWRFVGDAALFFDGLSKNGQRIKERIDAIRKESLPATATETLREWHHALGIAYDPTLPIARQRAMLDAILTAQGNSTRNGLAYQVAKEYVGLTVGENSGADLPDDPAGVTYRSPVPITTTGWSNVGGTTKAIISDVLRITRVSTIGQIYANITGAYGAGRFVVVRARHHLTGGPKNIGIVGTVNGAGNTILVPYRTVDVDTWSIWSGYVAGDLTLVNVVANSGNVNIAVDDYIEISDIYIGTGDYLPNRYSIKGQVERVQDARRLGAIAAHFAPLHLLPTILGYTAQVAGNANPIPVNPTLDDPSIKSVNRAFRLGIGTLGLARLGRTE